MRKARSTKTQAQHAAEQAAQYAHEQTPAADAERKQQEHDQTRIAHGRRLRDRARLKRKNLVVSQNGTSRGGSPR